MFMAKREERPEWERFEPFLSLWPRRLIDGAWSAPTGQMWRRRTATGWEYRQDAETVEEFVDRSF